MRKGKAFIANDRWSGPYKLRIIPIIPKGYVIMRNNELAYSGIVFDLKGALSHIKHIESCIQSRAKFFGVEHCSFSELDELVLPIHPPKGTIGTMIKDIKEEESMAPIRVYPQLPSATEPVEE